MSNTLPRELIEAILEDSMDKLERINLRWAMSGEHKDLDTIAEEMSSIIYETAEEHLFVAREQEEI